MKPKNERPFYKVIAVLLAVTMMSAGLTGCDWFKPRQEESQQTIELEAPEPDEEDPGEDILDENEVSAEVDPTIEEKEEGQVKEEPQAEEPQTSKPSTQSTQPATKPSGSGQQSSREDQTTHTVTTSALTPDRTIKKEQKPTVVYQPVGTELVEKQQATALAQPTQQVPVPKKGTSYPNARFKKKGSYSESTIYKNGYIDIGAVTISNKTFTGDVFINVPSDTVTLKNVDIKGTLYINGGSDWVKLYDVNAASLVVDSQETARVFASRDTELSSVSIKSSAILEEGGLYSGSRGFTNVTVNAPKGTTLTLRNLKLNKLKTVTACEVVYDDDTIINYAYTNAPTELYGYGQINRLYCNSDGVYYDARPLYVETARGCAAPSRRSNSGSGSGSSSTDKKVTLHSISNQYLDIGEKKIVGIDHNGSSLKVTTSNASVAKVTYSNSKSHITMTGVKPGRATIKVTSSRSGYTSRTVSFEIVVKDTSGSKLQLSGISDKKMEEGSVRYISVNTNASRIKLSNSNSNVAQVTADGFQLKVRAIKAGTTTVKVTASRSGYTSKSTTFQVTVYRNSSSGGGSEGGGDRDTVYIRSIDDQVLSRGSERIINVRTDASAIDVSTSNSSVVKVSSRRDDTIVLEAVGAGTAKVTVTGSRRGYYDTKVSFWVDVYGSNISAPTVYVNAGSQSYPNGSWTNQNVTFTLTGYGSGRKVYSYDRPAKMPNEKPASWGNRQQLTDGTLTVKNEGQRDYYFFTDGSAGSSEATGIYTVRIDKTMPTVTAIDANNNTLTFQVADALSGVKSVAVSGNNITTKLATSSDGKYRFVADKKGSYTILVTDNAGNVNNQYKVDLEGSTQTDTEPPVIGMAKEDSINGTAWYKEDKLVRLTITDNVGVQSVQVKVQVQGTEKGLSVEHISGTDIYQFVADKEGAVVYEITARDAAGNKAEMPLAVRVDKSAPTLGAITTQGTTVTFQANDTVSGIGNIFVVPADNTTAGVQINGETVEQNGNGTYSFIAKENVNYTITAVDKAGNGSKSEQVMISTTTPTPPSTVENPVITITKPDDTLAQSKDIKVQVDANLTGTQKLQVSISPTGKQQPVNLLEESNIYHIEVGKNGTYTITAVILEGTTEKARATQTVEVKGIDSEKPVIAITQNQNGVVEFTVTDLNSVTAKFDGTEVKMNLTTTSQGLVYSGRVENVQPGKHTIVATDKVGNQASADVVVAAAKQQPTLKAGNQQVNETATSVVIPIEVSDADGSPAQVKVTSDKGQLTGSGSSYTLTVTENGTYTVTAEDSDSNRTQVQIPVEAIKGNVAPTVKAGSQQVNETATSVTIPIEVSDADGNAAQIKVTSDKGQLTGSGSSYTLTVTENGTYTVTAEDSKGSRTQVQIPVEAIKGNVAPTLKAGNQQVNETATSVTIPIEVSDADGNAAQIKVTSDKGQLTGSGSSYTLTVTENGTYTVTAEDSKGSRTQVQIPIEAIKGNVAPTIAAEQPQIIATSATIRVTVDDNGGTEITSVTDQNLNAAALQADGSYLLTVTEDGSYTITATNKAGKSAYTTVVVSGIDRTPPVVEQPTVSYNENMTSAQIVLKANDGNGSGIAKVTASGVEMSLSEGNYILNVTQNGEYAIVVTDKAGNQAQAQVTVNGIDKTNPDIRQTSDNNGWKQKHEVTFAVTDEGSGISSVQVTKDGKTITHSEGNGYRFTAEENGSYLITATDKAGNSATKTVEIKTVDQTAPTVVPQLKNGDKAINPYNGKDASIYQGGKVTGYTVSVPQEATAASPLSVQVKTDKQTEFKTLSKDNMKIILTEGTHAVTLRAIDGAGNVGKEVQYKIKVDLQTTQTQKPAGETKPDGAELQQSQPADVKAQQETASTKQQVKKVRQSTPSDANPSNAAQQGIQSGDPQPKES
ncbi:MAG: hypothetical protein ACLVD4_10585 [Negativibacillus sp.]